MKKKRAHLQDAGKSLTQADKWQLMNERGFVVEVADLEDRGEKRKFIVRAYLTALQASAIVIVVIVVLVIVVLVIVVIVSVFIVIALDGVVVVFVVAVVVIVVDVIVVVVVFVLRGVVDVVVGVAGVVVFVLDYLTYHVQKRLGEHPQSRVAHHQHVKASRLVTGHAVVDFRINSHILATCCLGKRREREKERA